MENEPTACYSQPDVMDLVIKRLYFGKRPDKKAMATNGSILKRLHETRGYDWDACARIVEGLAMMRDQGKLEPTISRTKPVDLRWVWSKGQTLNLAEACQDAFYAGRPQPIVKTRGGKPFDLSTLLEGFGHIGQ